MYNAFRRGIRIYNLIIFWQLWIFCSKSEKRNNITKSSFFSIFHFQCDKDPPKTHFFLSQYQHSYVNIYLLVSIYVHVWFVFVNWIRDWIFQVNWSYDTKGITSTNLFLSQSERLQTFFSRGVNIYKPLSLAE